MSLTSNSIQMKARVSSWDMEDQRFMCSVTVMFLMIHGNYKIRRQDQGISVPQNT